MKAIGPRSEWVGKSQRNEEHEGKTFAISIHIQADVLGVKDAEQIHRTEGDTRERYRQKI